MLRKQTSFYRGVKSKEGKRRADLPFVATGRAELKFPDEEEEKEGVSDELTDGRTDQSEGAEAGDSVTGKRRARRRDGNGRAQLFAFQFFKT